MHYRRIFETTTDRTTRELPGPMPNADRLRAQRPLLRTRLASSRLIQRSARLVITRPGPPAVRKNTYNIPDPAATVNPKCAAPAKLHTARSDVHAVPYDPSRGYMPEMARFAPAPHSGAAPSSDQRARAALAALPYQTSHEPAERRRHAAAHSESGIPCFTGQHADWSSDDWSSDEKKRSISCTDQDKEPLCPMKENAGQKND